MAAAYVGLSADAGDAPGCIREALARLESSTGAGENSDLYVRERDGAPLLYSCVVRTEFGGDHAATLNALQTECELLAAEDITTLAVAGDPPGGKPLEPSWIVAMLHLQGISAPPHASVKRIVGTARLARMPAVDYDASQGAGADYDALRPLSAFDLDIFSRVAQSIEGDRPSGTDGGPLRVLDVGCGTGRFTKLLAARGFETTGVDKSRVMLEGARVSEAASAVNDEQAKHKVRYLRCDANDQMPEGQWDALTFFFSAQYMAFDRPFWSRVRSALKPSGAIAFATFAHRHFIETELTRFFPSIPRIDLARFPSIPALRRDLQANGFDQLGDYEVAHRDEVPPPVLIGRVERKYLSSLHLLEPAEYEAGLARMRSELHGMPSLRRTLRATVVTARLPGKAG